MDYKILKLAVENSIGVITISRPEALNALNTDFFKEMDSLLDDIAGNNEISVVIITGEGKAFAAGADIAEMCDKTQQEGYDFSKFGQAVFDKIEKLSKPVIAAVNGFALGGGCELAMSCDFRIASSKAKFGQPEVNLGLTPGFAGTQRLSRLVGLADALYLLYTADMINADEAYRLKLVQKVVEPEQLMEEALSIARKIASKGPEAIKHIKKSTRNGFNTDFASGCEIEAKAFSSLFEKEGAEGMKAFLEKRKPKW
ncbi:MAG: enoyl-CoA hydratase/isomerase family protein [Candidatus Cloacimonetes bacterium]|nr:enoyl-CoA hydratase/isomerase family protein [Candidatus Cloacimonadota bacterium]MCF7813384.1 enoyl-CoA hydratase/isomerase family protein [Candidatus Cloacimonadota bacterium]MCF7867491.1 enoyl-CoA hydratase/isomerase family protein [Candidatus Cloacimonadota bacterium]MCF7883006.1 enoyl-CoA hydratase/isomerase family protein [Candidatus Cloacimonadota bacterium]